MNYTKPLIGIAVAIVFTGAHAASDKPQAAQAEIGTSGMKGGWSDRNWSRTYEDDKQALQSHLDSADSEEQLRSLLKKRGFMITSINEMDDDEIEFEIVKDQTTFEVHADKNGNDQLGDIDVTSNYWIAEQTKRALHNDAYVIDSVGYDPALGAVSRDVQYLPQWMAEKEKLEQTLITGNKLVDYMTRTKAMGYQITSINDSEPGYVEYEIVKDGNSYEVQLVRDEITQIVKDVDVTANLWMSEKTEAALGE